MAHAVDSAFSDISRYTSISLPQHSAPNAVMLVMSKNAPVIITLVVLTHAH